jgi:penicillin-binding protein 2
MKVFRWINIVLILTFLMSCSSGSADGTPGGNPISDLLATPTPLPTAHVTIIPAPDAQAAVTQYLQAMQRDDYSAMYDMLAKQSRESITLEDFSKYYKNTLNEMSAASFEFTVLSSLLSPTSAQVAFGITYHTALVGDIQRDIPMNLVNEGGAWKVSWSDSLILPELAGGNQLAMEYNVPARGDIYNRDGQPIVSQADAFALGIQTDQIDPDRRALLTQELGRLCGYDPEFIEDQIDASGPGWYLPMCEATREEAQGLLSIGGGLKATEYRSRYYFGTGVAPQSVGYTLSIFPEQYDAYRRRGYDGSEKVGSAGIEKWAEDYLSGQHGGTLRVISPGGQPLGTLGQSSSPRPADSVYLTLDGNLQKYAQQSIEFFRGAVVVMEVDTGRVLAIASGPDFDPNFFDPANENYGAISDFNEPLLNRATQGQYPLGSVFKIITFAAALESGLYQKETTYDCQYEFTRLPDRILHDWTWQHCQDSLAAGEACDGSSELPSGLVTLQEGLMRSCNPYFWEIGWDLYTNWQRGTDIANMARKFGLGSPTGIGQLDEESGQILDPTDQISAVNQAIGQGDVQVTPLQVARFIAAIANGGTLYRPQLVERIQPIEGDPLLVFKPEAQGTLPLRTETLTALQEAMYMVTNNPKGTARFNLRGFIEQYNVAGKTGTAESGNGKSHAWFAGYTLNEANTSLPDIAIVVIVENIGEGSDYGVPIFRALAETYYYGSPQSIPAFGPIGRPPYTPTPAGGFSP